MNIPPDSPQASGGSLLAEALTVSEITSRVKGLLEEALPNIEKMADVLATGPVAGPVEHLADDIQAALAKAKEGAA